MQERQLELHLIFAFSESSDLMQICNDNLKNATSSPAVLTLQYECAKLLHALGRTSDSLFLLSQSVSSFLKSGKCKVLAVLNIYSVEDFLQFVISLISNHLIKHKMLNDSFVTYLNDLLFIHLYE